jgi:hypothetical protein
VRSITFTFSSLECMCRYLPWLDLSLNKRPLSGFQLRQPMPTSRNAFNRGLRPSGLIASSSNILLFFSCSGEVKTAHFTYEDASPLITLSFSSLPWFQILSFRFGYCWSLRSCLV